MGGLKFIITVSVLKMNAIRTMQILWYIILLITNNMAINPNIITVRTFNCRGAMSSCIYIQDLLSTTDILCVQEHHLTTENESFLSTLHSDYSCFIRCESNISLDGIMTRQCGIAIMWKNNVGYAVTPLSVGDNRIQGIRLDQTGQMPIYVFNVYLPSANHDFYEYEECLNNISDIYSYYINEGVVILAGDLDTDFQLGQKSYIRAGCDVRRIRMLEQFMLSTNQQSLVTHSMCKGPLLTYYPYSGDHGSQIDHIFIQNSHLHMVEHVMVHGDDELNTSDHHPVCLRILCNIPRFGAKSRTTYRWDKSDPTIYRDTLEGCVIVKNLTNRRINSRDDIDNLYKEIQISILETSDKCIPKSQFCAYKKPYWTDEIKQLYARQRQMRRIWINQGQPRGSTYQSYVDYKSAKNIFAKTSKKSASEYEQRQYDDVMRDEHGVYDKQCGKIIIKIF